MTRGSIKKLWNFRKKNILIIPNICFHIKSFFSIHISTVFLLSVFIKDFLKAILNFIVCRLDIPIKKMIG